MQFVRESEELGTSLKLLAPPELRASYEANFQRGQDE